MKLFGLNLTLARKAASKPMMLRRFDAARTDRLYQDWIFSHTSANAELLNGNLATIRSRARDLERNENLARKFLLMCETNIVGRGFLLRLTVDGDTPRAIERAFHAWLDRADVTGQLSGPDLQRLAIRTTARDGEVFSRLYRGGNYPDGLGVQLLEGDYVDHEYTDRASTPRRMMGVEVDAFGRAVAFYVFKQHPGDWNTHGYTRGATVRISADDMLQTFRLDRPGQVRGVSWMCSGMTTLKMLNGYRESELVAARAAACKMGFYKIPPGEDFSGDGKTAEDAPVSDAAPGTFERMPTGWEFQQYDPQHPTAQFPAFVKDIQRDIASGWGVAYNNLANDLEGVNYSSIRSGSIDERENWLVEQARFSQSFMRRLYRAWLPLAVTAGTVTIPAAQIKDYISADTWTGRRWPWVDPSNEIAAKEKEIALGLISPSQIVTEAGGNYEQVQQRIAEDNATRAKFGLPAVGESAPASKGK